MNVIEYFIVIVYSAAIVVLFVFALAQLNLLINYLLFKKKNKRIPRIDLESLANGYPTVTIQLPVFNELYVIEDLLKNISEIDYPKDKLEIQVLDDSIDESFDLTRTCIKKLQEKGFDIHHIHRKNRTNFKAGALKEGLATAKGEFIAIFDADFLPKPDWLLQTLPHFHSKDIGAIQTRWGHLNKNHSILTKIQAFALDAHFTFEQVGRNVKGHFINFNGTAGIWRKECIIDAGNWEGDTLTEDLDLSYRAQLNGWKLLYLEHVETLAELPLAISAAKSQQFRWNKGGAENFRKMAGRVLKSKRMSIRSKIHAMLHLLSSTMFLNAFILAVLSVPMLYIKNNHQQHSAYYVVLGFFGITTLIFFVYYWIMFKIYNGRGLKNFITYIGLFFTFFSVLLGFSFHNTVAVIQGHLGKRSEFIRTPKFNLRNTYNNWKENKYINKKWSVSLVLEGLLLLYFAFGMYSAFIVSTKGDFGMFPFHLMLFIGFGYVFVNSLTNKI